jgi:hypothetical protein
MSKLMTVDTQGYRRELPHKRKLILITEDDNPKKAEVEAAVKTAMEHLVESVEFKVVDPSKHPNIGKKLGAKMQEQFTVKDHQKVMLEPALLTPTLVFLEDDIVVWQKDGIMRPEVLWAAMTRKPVYNQPGPNVVPVNPHL